MAKKINRISISASLDPNKKLTDLLGDNFEKYRKLWAEAEAGEIKKIPLHLDIDLTNACNLKCPMCPAGNSGHFFPGFKKNIFLDYQFYEKALTEAAEFGLPSLRLGVSGEPLLVEGIADWVSKARQSGLVDISLITNAQLLNRKISQDLIKSGLTKLMISVDAASEKTYKKVRPGGNWKKLQKNINDFLSIREELASPLPLLRLSFVEMNLNWKEKDLFEQMFSNKADYICFQRYQNILGSEETNFKIEKALANNIEDKSPKEQHTAGLTLVKQELKAVKNKLFCAEPFTRLAIHADGGMFPCCSDFGRQKALGNIKNDTILSVWNSKEASSLRELGAEKREPCRTCLQR